MWSQADTATAARRCTMPCHDRGRQVHTSVSRWAFTVVAFKFSALRFQGRPRTFFNSLITNLSSGGTRCNDLAFWTPFSVRNDVFVCHWRLANPDSMVPSLIQIDCWHGRVLVRHSFSEWQHVARVRFPKNTHKRSSLVVFHLEPRQAPHCVSNQPLYQDAVAW